MGKFVSFILLCLAHLCCCRNQAQNKQSQADKIKIESLEGEIGQLKRKLEWFQNHYQHLQAKKQMIEAARAKLSKQVNAALDVIENVFEESEL